MARTWGQGRKLPKSSPIGEQSGFLQEDESGTVPDGVKWTPASELATAIGIPDVSEADDGQILVVEDGALVVGDASGGGANVAWAQLTKAIPETTPTVFDTTDLFAANGTGITFNTGTDRFENVPNGTLVEVEFTAQNAGDGGTWLFRGTAQENGGDIGNPGVVVAASTIVDFSIPAFAVSASGNVAVEAHFVLLDTLTDATVTAFVKFTVPPA